MSMTISLSSFSEFKSHLPHSILMIVQENLEKDLSLVVLIKNMKEEDVTENAVLIVHPLAPYKNKYDASGLSFLKRRAYRRNCRDFLKYAKDSNFFIFHLRDVYDGEPPLEKKFKIKPDLVIPTALTSGTPICIPICPKKKFNLYVCGAYAGSCIKTAVESFLEHMKSLYLVLNCIVPKYDNLLASEYDGDIKLAVFQSLGAKEVVHKK